MSTLFPPAYELDDVGRRVLVGLSFSETSEFEQLDASLPYAGKIVLDFGAVAPPLKESRWLHLWAKHRTAVANKGGCRVGTRC